MKKILLIGGFAILALLPRHIHAQFLPPAPPQIPSSYQSESGDFGDIFTSIFSNLLGSVNSLYLQQSGPILEIWTGEQPQVVPAPAPEGVIVPSVSITLRGENGGSDVDGLYVQFRWAEGTITTESYEDLPIDGYVLLDGNTPLGPIQKVDHYTGKVIMNRIYIRNSDTKTITVGALMKASLAEDMGKYFSVSITGVATTSTVTGTMPVVGGLKNISDTKAGRLAIVGTVGNNRNYIEAYPLISDQTGMEVHLISMTEQPMAVPMFVVDARCQGGNANDVSVTLRTADGEILSGPQQMEASMLYGQSSAKLKSRFDVGKGTFGDCIITYRLGMSWVNGGTISFSVDKSKCIALGGDGFLSVPLPLAIISGPTILVLPVATTFSIDQVVEMDTGDTIIEGQNDFAAIEITAPADKPLAIQSLGGWIGWTPSSDDVDDVNIYGFILGTESTPTVSIPGLQPDGAFLTEGLDMRGRRWGGTFWAEDTANNQSAAIIPAGEKGYFTLRGNYNAPSENSKVSAEIFDWNTEETLTLQYKSRKLAPNGIF
ncbi:MAG: hypothetical protein NUV53_02915 [Patescibacteria group bacterium]|nr:hypothetical protein [Patescibacteria group bacterium]